MRFETAQHKAAAVKKDEQRKWTIAARRVVRMRNGPPGPSMVCSRTLPTSAGGAISAMRASYCARATPTGSVCVAGTPVPLSSSSWICGSTGIRVLRGRSGYCAALWSGAALAGKKRSSTWPGLLPSRA